MTGLEAFYFSIVVTLATWLTPMPIYAQGKLVWYGNQRLVEANAEYRGYDLSFYKERCGVAVMSPTDLGKIVWIRPRPVEGEPLGPWYGPCLSVDVAARAHFARTIGFMREIAEVSTIIKEEFGFEYGVWGQIYVGQCPSPTLDLLRPDDYDPELVEDKYNAHIAYSLYPYPEQEIPIDCDE